MSGKVRDRPASTAPGARPLSAAGLTMTAPDPDRDPLRALLARCHRGVLATIGRTGAPQLSTIDYTFSPRHSVLRMSTTAGRAKLRNIDRDPRVSLHASTPDGGAYVVAEGIATMSPIASAIGDRTVDELIDVYRLIQGEHPDWQDYRTAMITDHRLVLSVVPTRLYGWIPT